MELKKMKGLKPIDCVGKHCLYGQHINNYTPLSQLSEGDITEVSGDFMNVNLYAANGNISNFWLSIGHFPIISILGDAIHPTKVVRNLPLGENVRDFHTGDEL